MDPATRSLTVYVQVPNADGRLKGNTFASGRVIGRTVADALLLPAPAVRETAPDSSGLIAAVDRAIEGCEAVLHEAGGRAERRGRAAGGQAGGGAVACPPFIP